MPDVRGWQPPSEFDEYRLIRQLGRGGMGEVWLAHDTVLDRPVAVKFIADLWPGAAARHQFLVEARAAARLSHPNVVTIHRVGEIAGLPFIVSEFVRGTSLDKAPKPMPPARVIELGIGLARGLAAAHRRGVLHRDIKPGNAIIAEEGEVKLLDFGLAKLLDRGSRVSLPDTAMPHAPVQLPPSPAAAGTFDTVVDVPLSREVWGGTPYYMAPELWQGEPASYRTDVYALGAVLFELCAGMPVLAGRGLHEIAKVVLSEEPPSLRQVAPGTDRRLAAVVARCLRRNPSERFANGDELREALEALVAGAPRDTVPEGNPYRGLLPFDAEHRTLFFGRTTEIGTLIERLRSEPLVVIAGDSGVGKSSLCRAGILPLVAEGALGEERTWSIARLTPGKRPVAALAAALAGATGADEEVLAAAIEETPAWLGRDLRVVLGQDRNLVVCVDHLEELVTIADPTEARITAEALFHLVSHSPGIRTLCTVRGDFLTRVAALPLFGDEISRAIYLLRPLSPEKIREAIVGPARAKGVSFESKALVDKLVTSTSRAEGLPLLQFALAELWEARSDPQAPITADALDAIGGVAGALARHADRILAGLSAPERDASRRILIELVSIEGTRAYRSESDLCEVHPRARDALDALVRGRLLVAREGTAGATYEIAHEALLRGWTTLRCWLDEQDEVRIVAQRLVLAAAEWERLGKTREALWGERQLMEAALVDENRIEQREGAFLHASRRATIRRRRLRRALVFGLPAAGLFIFTTIRFFAERELDRKITAHIEQARDLHEQARRAHSDAAGLEREAFAAFDARRIAEGEDAWSRALSAATAVDPMLGRAGQVLEAALILDSTRKDVRGMLGDVLDDRARNAERAHELEHQSDLLARMALHDLDGRRRQRWDAPAHLSIQTIPPGARIVARRYGAQGQQRVLEEEERDLGRTPIVEAVVPRGSYLLTLTADGHPAVRYPVLLGRGQRLDVSVRLPLAEEIPPGFVFIPAGRFLFGTSIDEAKRKGFLSTVPVHEVTTGDYLIGMHEVTYAEYLTYLRALPAGERAKRAPRIGEGASDAAIGLSEMRDGRYQLSIKFPDETYTASEGRLFTYRARSRRSTQDWLRFPVSGLSARDAAAYAAWLHDTGRVPNARLCTEYEWERAARGADTREFPHGDDIGSDDANFDETYGKDLKAMGPDEIGSYPASMSPFGLYDTCGNVLEWTISSLEPDKTVVRGGGYYYDRTTARATNRTILDPSLRDARLGLRVCADTTSLSAGR